MRKFATPGAGRSKAASAFICAAFVLVACSSGPLFIQPTSVGTLQTTDSWTNSPVPYPCPQSTSGLFSFNPDSANLEVGVGFDLFFDQGTLPFPCQESHGVLAKANILFDHEELRPTTFDNARLKFRLRSTAKPISSPCLFLLSVATEPWPRGFTSLGEGATGSSPGYDLPPAGDRAFYFVSEPLPSGFVSATDVTAEVRSWLDGTSVNYGFVLIPFASPTATEDMQLGRLRRLNASCTALANDFRIEITRGP